MTNVQVQRLVPSFVVSSNRVIELLLQGSGFADLKDKKVDIVIESKDGVRWNVDTILSETIEFEGETFFIVNAAPVNVSFPQGGRAYTNLKITLKIDERIISSQTFKVFYADPILG